MALVSFVAAQTEYLQCVAEAAGSDSINFTNACSSMATTFAKQLVTARLSMEDSAAIVNLLTKSPLRVDVKVELIDSMNRKAANDLPSGGVGVSQRWQYHFHFHVYLRESDWIAMEGVLAGE